MNTTLPEKELKRIQQLFNYFDPSKKGSVSVVDIGKMLHALGHRPSEEELRAIITDIGFKGNGTIEFPDFVSLVVEQKKSAADAGELEEAFKVFDKDGNGFISKDELLQGFRLANEVFNEDDIEEIFRITDTDGDGQLNFEEFVSMLRSREEVMFID